MAKKTESDAPIEMEAQYVGPIPGTVRVWNLRPEPRDLCLADSTNVHLWPFTRTGQSHISEPIKKLLLTDAIRKMERRGELKIVAEVA